MKQKNLNKCHETSLPWSGYKFVIVCMNNLDYRVSKISLMWVRVGDGILGMERKQKSLNGAI